MQCQLQVCGLLLRILIFIQENGPFKSDIMLTLLRLITSVALFPLCQLKTEETLSVASEFLNILILAHQTKSPENDLEGLRLQIDEEYYQGFTLSYLLHNS